MPKEPTLVADEALPALGFRGRKVGLPGQSECRRWRRTLGIDRTIREVPTELGDMNTGLERQI